MALYGVFAGHQVINNVRVCAWEVWEDHGNSDPGDDEFLGLLRLPCRAGIVAHIQGTTGVFENIDGHSTLGQFLLVFGSKETLKKMPVYEYDPNRKYKYTGENTLKRRQERTKKTKL